jgi:predicted amidohydrolase
VWLLLGSAPIATGDGKVFNRSFMFTPDGKIAARYDKINLFDVTLGGGETYRESDTVQGGAQAVIVDGPMGARIGMTTSRRPRRLPCRPGRRIGKCCCARAR